MRMKMRTSSTKRTIDRLGRLHREVGSARAESLAVMDVV